MSAFTRDVRTPERSTRMSRRTSKTKTPEPINVFQDRSGNWIATRVFTYASGAQGVDRVVVMKHTTDCFADAEQRDEAERRARAMFKETT